jgi:ankyrin repeat protein
MSTAVKVGMSVLAVLALLLFGIGLVDPRAPIWLLGGGWRDSCDRDPIATYLAGNRCPNQARSPLTEANANVKLSASGQCPLVFAAAHANVPAVDELLRKGADPKLCDRYPEVLYEMALGGTCSSSPGISESLLLSYERAGIRPTDPQELLFMSARRSCEPGIRSAIASGASPSQTDASGLTPLHYVISSTSDTSIESAATLVRAGASASAIGSDGVSVLAEAKRQLDATTNWPRMEAALLGTHRR